MKKILMFFSFAMTSVMVNAQTVENSRLFENTYVSVEGGVVSPMVVNNGFFSDMRPTLGVEFGKNITPVWGFSVEALGAINTTGAATWFDQSNVRFNGKMNLSNLFGGYKGEPRVVEFSLVPGMGWGRDWHAVYPNYDHLTYNAFGQIDFNLGKQKAWQINVKPGVVFAARNGAYGMHKEFGTTQLTFGLTYKFGSKSKKSHNFVVCPYTVTKADYDAVLAENATLKGREPETVEVVKETVVEKEVRVIEAAKTNDYFVVFPINKATLDKSVLAAEKAKLADFVAGLNGKTVTVVGSADSATGTKAFNETLAQKRADYVATLLRDLGVKDVKVTTKLDAHSVAEAARAAVVVVD